MKLEKKKMLAQKRRWRVRSRVFGTAERPRLVVRFSNKHICAQCIDDKEGKTLVSLCSLSKELNGEKIDIIPWSEDPLEYIAKALSPAKVLKVSAIEGEKVARVVVPDDKLSLAIGRDGQNARLAARLTGWKVDVKSESKAAAEEAESRGENEATEEFGEEE